MQSPSANSIAAAPLMDPIGLTAQRAWPADGTLPFESLLESPSSRTCKSGPEKSLPPPRPAESMAPEAGPREESEDADLPLPRCGNESIAQETTEQAAIDEELASDDAAAMAQVAEDLSAEEPVDPRSAEELLAASLAAIHSTPVQPAVVDPPTATEEAAESVSIVATDLETAAIGILETAPATTVGLTTALDVSESAAVADVDTTAIPGSNSAAIVATAAPEIPADLIPAELAVGTGHTASAEATADMAASAAEESAVMVDPAADEPRDQREPEAQTETFQPPEMPPDSQLPPVANVAASQTDSPPGAPPQSASLPATDAAVSNRQRIPDAVLGSPGTANGRPSQELAVDSVRLLQRVARAFAAAHERGSEVRLRLSPPELGAIRLEVQIRDGAMVARVEAETSAARTAIVESLPVLRERLADQGIRVERFEVDLMNQQGSGTPDQPAPGDHEAAVPLRAAARAATRRETTTVQPPAAALLASPGRLNVIV